MQTRSNQIHGGLVVSGKLKREIDIKERKRLWNGIMRWELGGK